jgi:bifunctional oligoribonuclease and PAP phosphatase NrnA
MINWYNIIGEKMKLNPKQIERLIQKIEQYQNIAVFRHESPDFDALGSQYGMINWLKNNFKNKKIIGFGLTNVDVGMKLFKPLPKSKIKKPFLAIVLDTANQARISDETYKDAEYIIKIDHHPSNDAFGDLNIVETNASSVGELLYYIFNSKKLAKYKFSKSVAHNLLIGLVGDTGRLLFPSVTNDTIEAYHQMTKLGVDMQAIFYGMYTKSISELEIIKRVYQNLKVTKKGLGYFIFTDQDLISLNIHPDVVVKYLPLLANYQEIKIFASVTQDKSKNYYRVSIRSNNIVINKVAQSFNGGGHKYAAGAKVSDINSAHALLKELESLIGK